MTSLQRRLLTTATATAFAVLSGTVAAAPIVMEGDFVRTAVSDNGTLGFGGTAPPGILHDPTGTGTFGADDYLTPGTPFEGFGVYSTESGLRANENSTYFPDVPVSGITGSISDISGGSSFDQAVNFSGAVDTFFTISTDTYFNDGDERISMTTTIMALTDLTDVSFARWTDPDQDVVASGSHFTENARGTGSLSGEDWVGSVGPVTGLALGLFSDDPLTHDTAVIGFSSPTSGSAWATHPEAYLTGIDDGDGDYSIGIGFDIGSLAAGESVTFTYHYVMGDSLETIDIPGEVPAPATLLLVGLGIAGLGLSRRRRS